MIDNLKRRIDGWKRYRRTYNELAQMSERELRDLNISRSDIDRLAREAVR